MTTDTKGRAPWEGATLSGAVRLLALLGNERESDAATVRRRFEETARDYGAHLSLLKALGMAEQEVERTAAVGVSGKERVSRKRGPGGNKRDLARRLLRSQHEIGKHARAVVARTLNRDATEKDGRAQIYPTERNLLIEAGVLRVDHDNALYEVTEEWHAQCVSAAFCRGKSPIALEGELKRQAEIGLRAEQAVLELRARQSTGGGSSESHPCGSRKHKRRIRHRQRAVDERPRPAGDKAN